MLTSGTISTIAGKLVAGPVCAALGPKHVGWLSLLACALPLVTASNGYSVLVAWNIARFGQSMTWPVTNILFDAWFPSDEQGKAWGVMGTSSRAGILSLTLALNLFGDGLDTAALFSTWSARTVCCVALPDASEHPISTRYPHPLHPLRLSRRWSFVDRC